MSNGTGDIATQIKSVFNFRKKLIDEKRRKKQWAIAFLGIAIIAVGIAYNSRDIISEYNLKHQELNFEKQELNFAKQELEEQKNQVEQEKEQVENEINKVLSEAEIIAQNNLYLTDDPNVLNKYKLPTVEMKANGYLLIYLSGNASYVENDIYANFKLSEGEELILSNGTNIIDRIKIVNLSENISYGKKDDKWYYYTSPTPGFENNTAYHTSVGG